MTEKKKKRKAPPTDSEEQLHRARSDELIRIIREEFAQTPLGREIDERLRRRAAGLPPSA
jgi:hypothetical protein